jgi:hypothetical protein
MILTVEKISRISEVQENRLIVAGILSVFSVIYFCVLCMALYISIPMWLVVVNIACLFINVPLIWWLLSLYVEQRKKINNSIKE